MATYSVYNNILIKLENVFLRVENEVDREITSLLAENHKLNLQLIDLKSKVEVLNSLKRSFELYYDNPQEMVNLNRSLFKVLCDKQLLLRFLQEKEILLSSCLVAQPDQQPLPVIQLNKELKIRKRLQEIELLASFLADDPRFSAYRAEVERANEIFDLGVESGAMDKLESVIELFHLFFEKLINFYELDPTFIRDFQDFRSQILVQANSIVSFTPNEVINQGTLQKTYHSVKEERMRLEQEVDKLLYQFSMMQNGKKIILAEIKNASGELESVLFKEYALKQKIEELRQYKVELNHQKDSFMKDPSLDGYTEAVQQLEIVESRFKRLIMHKTFEQPVLATRFFAANQIKTEQRIRGEESSSHSKMLFQVLHNNHVLSQDKIVILRLSNPSKLINANSGKFFYQRTSKTRSLQSLENSFNTLQTHELH